MLSCNGTSWVKRIDFPLDFVQSRFNLPEGLVVLLAYLSASQDFLLISLADRQAFNHLSLHIAKNPLPSHVPLMDFMAMMRQRVFKQNTLIGEKDQDSGNQDSKSD